MKNATLAPLATWLVEPLPAEVAQSVDRIRRTDDVRYVAIMPDVHLAAEVCVGAVVGTSHLIYPAAIGGDIGCGMAAVAVHADSDLLGNEHSAARLLAGLSISVPSNKHYSKRSLPEKLTVAPLSDPALVKAAERDGRVQLGTLGRGNHFLEFQADADDRLWIMLHSGSRSMGQLITQHHTQSTSVRPPALPHLDASRDAGQAYLADVDWARRYADANRLAMLRAVEELLTQLFQCTLDWSTLIHRDHNHIQREQHFGQSMWVHRKGAQAMQRDAEGIIPGSMGTTSYHVAGRGHADALESCSHGAGRRLSRSEAARKISVRELARQMDRVWYDHRRASLLRDEAPAVYKDVRKVLRAQCELVRITRELRPLLSYKG